MWSNLYALLASIEGPWMCFGDFNLTLCDEEKVGSKRGSGSTPNLLQEIMFEFEAVDLGFTGSNFTWCNKRWGRGCIR